MAENMDKPKISIGAGLLVFVVASVVSLFGSLTFGPPDFLTSLIRGSVVLILLFLIFLPLSLLLRKVRMSKKLEIVAGVVLGVAIIGLGEMTLHLISLVIP